MKVTFAEQSFPAKFWDGEEITAQRIAVDTETLNIEEGETPPLVLLQVFDGQVSWLADWKNGEGLVKQFENKELIMHNAAFDVAVLEKAFDWDFWDHVERGLLWDTGVMFRLADLAKFGRAGRWSLDHVCRVLYGENIDKNPELRMNWSQDRRAWEWEGDRIRYAALDPVATYFAYEGLEWVRHEKNALTHNIQLKGEIALSRISNRGMCFNLDAKDKFLEAVDEHINSSLQKLAGYGYVPGMEGINAVTQGILQSFEESEEDVILPRSPKAKLITTKRDDLKEYRGRSVFIDSLLEFKEFKKLKDFFTRLNASKVYPRYNGILNTTRTSCSSPNIQQLPRRPGIRECFVPSPGCVFVDVDYSAIELVTLAQTTYSMYGFSKMREIINSGTDLHTWCAAAILNKEMSDVTKVERQGAKSLNFGKPGGLGARKLRDYAEATYGVKWTEQEAQAKCDAWVAAFPEMELWLEDAVSKKIDWEGCPISGTDSMQKAITMRICRGNYASKAGNPYGKEVLYWVWNEVICKLNPTFEGGDRQYIPEKHFNQVFCEPSGTILGFKRGRASYCAARNTKFQGLAAQGAKVALWMLEKAGFKTVAFVHDQALVEVPKEEAEAAMVEISRLMVEGMKTVCPDVDVKVEGEIRERWGK